MLRILHIGLGPLGQAVVADLYERGLGELVAAVDTAPDVAGKPIERFVPGARATGKVLPSLSKFRDWKRVDCALVTTSSDLGKCADTFRALLQMGLCVVSTCEELVWPALRHPRLARDLDELARKKGGRLLGTGVNPGFLMDALPLFSTAVCRKVESLRIARVQDATTRRIPFQQKIGVGLSEEQFVGRVQAGTLRHVGLGESLHFLAHHLGFAIDHWDEELSIVRAQRATHSALGMIAKGQGVGVRQVARGYEGHKLRLLLEFQAAIGQKDPHDRVLVEGEPPIDLVLRGGVHGDIATAAIVLNSIAALRASRPGLHTMASIPLVHCAPGA